MLPLMMENQTYKQMEDELETTLNPKPYVNPSGEQRACEL